MKVERTAPLVPDQQYKPITLEITLETYEEATNLFLRVCAAPYRFEDVEGLPTGFPAANDTAHDLYCALHGALKEQGFPVP